MSRKDSRLLKPLVWREIQNVLAGRFSRLCNGDRFAVRESKALGMSPEMVHRIQFGCGARQKAQLNPELMRPALTGTGCVLRGAVVEQHNLPAPPVGAQLLEKTLMRFLRPLFRNRQEYVTAVHMEHPLQDALGMIARNGNLSLLANAAVAAGQWWGFQNPGLVEH